MAKPHKEEPEFDIAKLVWERKDAIATQKGAEEAHARSKCKKVVDPGAMMISIYKSLIDNSIFADLTPFDDDSMTSDHEKSDSKNQVVPELYSLKDDSPTDDYFSVIDDYLRCDKHLDDLNLKHLDDIDLEHEPKDNYPSNGYIKIANLPL
ncbi:hypothetical protein RDI58_017743 [Solanum bulbocastanum]|uniref:Uncharacterized protein n=1 Tax=Solanum bulbocastanum TaxID=147425 RepID=A0AAN8TAE3_SOLBU